MDFGLPLRSSPKPIASPTHNPVQQNFRRWARVSFRKWAKVSCQTHHLHNLHKLKGLQGIRWGSWSTFGIPPGSPLEATQIHVRGLSWDRPQQPRVSDPWMCSKSLHRRITRKLQLPMWNAVPLPIEATINARCRHLHPHRLSQAQRPRSGVLSPPRPGAHRTPLPHRRTPALEPPRPLRSSHRYPLLNKRTLRSRGHFSPPPPSPSQWGIGGRLRSREP